MTVDENLLKTRKHIQFIGIGGSGMFPMVQILHSEGFYITGSDNNETETLQAVRDMGIPVYLGQRADLSVHIAFGIIVAVDKDKIIDVKPRQLLGNVAAESSAAYDQYSAAESLHYPPDAGDKNITLSPSFNFVLYIFSDAIFTSLT